MEPDVSRWVIIYPIYINSKKTLAEGRRIGISHACENPTIVEIGDCCTHLKLRHALEINKAYSRDYMEVGRVRVELKTEDGKLANPDIPTRKALMQKLGELVPKHTGRRKQQQDASLAASSSSKSSSSTKSAKKKR